MLLTSAAAPFADSGWVYQVKWDGVRNLSVVEDGQIRHWSRRLRERTPSFPEFEPLGELLRCPGRAVLDGEIVVLRGAKPSFAGILERDTSGRLDSRKLSAAPATLMLFDLLEWDGEALYERPLEERLRLLKQLVSPGPSWQMVEGFAGTTGPDLFRAVVEQGLEGLVAKRLNSKYRPGARSRDWVKIKRRQRMLAVVCGYTLPAGRSGGLLLGAYQEGQLRYIGRVGSGISAWDMQMLRANLPASVRPFDYEPNVRDRFSGAPGPVVWTEPRLAVEVEFTEWTEEQKLRDPVVVGFTNHPAAAAVIP